jgi:hypothetical protein
MSLRNAFATIETLFTRAIVENDTALMERLLLKGKPLDAGYLVALPRSSDLGKMKPEMARLLAEKMDAKVESMLDGYGLYYSRALLPTLFEGALRHSQNVALVAAFGNGHLPVQALAMGVLKFIEDPQARLSTFAETLGENVEKLSAPWVVAGHTLSQNMIAEFDVLVAAGFDLHKDNEAFLRKAAAEGNRDFALHLVQKHGADIDLAINTARNAGADNVRVFLEDLRLETHPDAPPLMSFEDMAKELITLRKTVKSLEQTVADLAAQMTELKNPAVKLNKSPLRKLA